MTLDYPDKPGNDLEPGNDFVETDIYLLWPYYDVVEVNFNRLHRYYLN